MSTGLSVKLPISIDATDGFGSLNKTFLELVHQNLKMLLLTSKGGRIMELNYGVGLRDFLFQQNSEVSYIDIKSKILEQLDRYFPYLQVNDVIVTSPSQNSISVTLDVLVLPLNIKTILNVTESINS